MENPTYKNGIKTLTETQLKNGLPSYDLLLKKIQIIRDNAAQMPEGVAVNGSFENLKYDNIFSILGGRGAGKTSILLTIYRNLEKDSDNINVLMPLIMPELIDSSDSFIGWILSSVEKNLDDLENKKKPVDIATTRQDMGRCARTIISLKDVFSTIRTTCARPLTT